MAVTITHVFLWGSSATNHIENALMGSPWFTSAVSMKRKDFPLLIVSWRTESVSPARALSVAEHAILRAQVFSGLTAN
jgi:hypothetical protein